MFQHVVPCSSLTFSASREMFLYDLLSNATLKPRRANATINGASAHMDNASDSNKTSPLVPRTLASASQTVSVLKSFNTSLINENDAAVTLGPVTSEKMWSPPLDARFLAVFGVGIFLALTSMIMSCSLANRHVNQGIELTGTASMDPQNQLAVRFILAVPAVALTGILGLVLPECRTIWQIFASMVAAFNFWRIPDYLALSVGGDVSLLERLKEVPKTQTAELYSNVLCFHCSICIRPKRPESSDLLLLRKMVMLNCFLQPTLALMDCVYEFENAKGAAFASSSHTALAVFSILKVLGTLMSAAACNGLVRLLTAVDEKAATEIQAPKVLLYCRTYLLSLNLLPVIAECLLAQQFQLQNGMVLTDQGAINLGSAWATCFGACLSALVARYAFPAGTPGTANSPISN